MRNRRREPPRDANWAAASADAFRGLSQPFLDRIGRDIGTAHKRAVQDIGGMIASATNLALAVELYLKALYIVLGTRVPRIHDLWALFNELPKDHKEAIEQRYATLAPPPGEDVYSLDVQISLVPFPEDETAKDGKVKPHETPPDNSLGAVLGRNKDAFETWRYLYERGDPDAIREFSYEFHYLGIAAESVRAHVVALLGKRRV